MCSAIEHDRYCRSRRGRRYRHCRARLGSRRTTRATGPNRTGLEALGYWGSVVSKTASAVAYGAQVQASTLPSCEQAFTGTVTVTNGGINVTGTSLFNSNVGIIGSLNASQNVTASQVHATQVSLPMVARSGWVIPTARLIPAALRSEAARCRAPERVALRRLPATSVQLRSAMARVPSA